MPNIFSANCVDFVKGISLFRILVTYSACSILFFSFFFVFPSINMTVSPL
ncbi:MAG: hypothetical protein DMNBKLKJ_00022 [Candidatus Westeberhardia cardiocondylae]|nr:hypothetical protein [Candidatus Westeberhardia cardiocondylae]